MPLRCLDENESIYAFNYSEDEWALLAQDNRQRHHLRMACCDAEVVVKRNQHGTQFFAHAQSSCAAAGESPAHVWAKYTIALAARDAGWEVTTEAQGDGDLGPWIADVLATRQTGKGVLKVAFEVQLSSQTHEETLFRQRRYEASGVRCMWFFRQMNFESSQRLPAFHLHESSAGLFVKMPSPRHDPAARKKEDDEKRWQQMFTLQHFVQGALRGKLKWMPALNRIVPASLLILDKACLSCNKPMRSIVRVHLNVKQVFSGFADISTELFKFRFNDSLFSFERTAIFNELFPEALLARHDISQVYLVPYYAPYESKVVAGERPACRCPHCGYPNAGEFGRGATWAPFKTQLTLTDEVVDGIEPLAGLKRWWFQEKTPTAGRHEGIKDES